MVWACIEKRIIVGPYVGKRVMVMDVPGIRMKLEVKVVG